MKKFSASKRKIALLCPSFILFVFVLNYFSAFGQGDTKSYVSSDKIVMLSYPANWKINDMEPNADLCVNTPDGSLFKTCQFKLQLSKLAEGYENYNIHQLSDVELKMMKAQSDSKWTTEIESSDFKKINGKEWWITKGKLTKKKDVYYADTYKAIHGKKVYIITYFSNEKSYPKYTGDVYKIVESLEFLNKDAGATNAGSSASTKSSDDRVSNTIPVISDKPLWAIKTATGWMKNKEGQWISGKNKIQKYTMSTADTANWSKGINATGLDNFLTIEARELKIEGKSLIVIIKIMKDGQRSYANIPDSWKPVTRAKYFVVKKNETSPEIKDGISDYHIKLYFQGYVAYDKDYLHNIALSISGENKENPDLKTTGSTTKIILDYKELADGKKCRFALVPSSATSLGVESPFDPTPQYQEFVYPGIGFPDFYYECDKAAMAGFLSIIESK